MAQRKRKRTVKKQSPPKKRALPLKKEISQRKGRGKYTISFIRKKRSKVETENMLRAVDYSKLIKAYPKTRFVHITIYGSFRGRTVARTYIADTEYFTGPGVENFLFEFVEEIFAGKLDYGVAKSNHWRNYITNIVFDRFIN